MPITPQQTENDRHELFEFSIVDIRRSPADVRDNGSQVRLHRLELGHGKVFQTPHHHNAMHPKEPTRTRGRRMGL